MGTEKTCTNEQLGNTRRIIGIITDVSDQKRPIITAIATAYIDGIEAGMQIAENGKN